MIEDLENNTIQHDQVVKILSLIIDTLIHNYEEYKDYNSTTTQSDNGSNLYMFLDFLRLKTSYQRFAWGLTPLVTVHENSCS